MEVYLTSKQEKPTKLGFVYTPVSAAGFTTFHRTNRKGECEFHFVENTNCCSRMVYRYNRNTGRLVYGNRSKWSEAEIRSASVAFNKGKPEKMPLPDNLTKIAGEILQHFHKYKPLGRYHNRKGYS